MKYTITWAHWRVPSEERAFDGWLEGSPTPEQRAEILGEVARERKNWAPSSEAWGQLRELERFVAKRVCIQFWDPIMHLLDDEGPYPVLADLKRIALLRREGFQQAYLVLDRIQEWPTMEGYSPAKFLDSEIELNCTLAAVAEVSAVDDGERDETGRVQYALVREAIIADRRALHMKLISRDRLVDQNGVTLEEANRFVGIEAARCRKLVARDRLVSYHGFTLEEASRFLGIGEDGLPNIPDEPRGVGV